MHLREFYVLYKFINVNVLVCRITLRLVAILRYFGLKYCQLRIGGPF